jgi:hypothetical protein
MSNHGSPVALVQVEVACPFGIQELAIHNSDEWKNMPKSEDFWDCCVAFCLWVFPFIFMVYH